MLENISLSRFVQSGYPALVFFAFVTAWSTVGQVNGFADLRRIPPFNWEKPNRTPASSPTTCSIERLKYPDVQSCKVDVTQPKTLLDQLDLKDSAQEGAKQASFLKSPTGLLRAEAPSTTVVRRSL